MKENKILFYISTTLCLICIFTSIYLYFFNFNNVNNYISNVLLSIFGSSCVLLATSLVNYSIERKKILEELMDECIKLEKLFSKIQYLQELDYGTYNQHKKFYKNLSKEIYQSSKEGHEQKQYQQMEKIMKQYINIIEYDLTSFYNIYNKIDFLINNKLKFDIHKKIFNYTMELKDNIVEYGRHFIIYFEATNGNKKVNYSFVRDLQKNIFDIEIGEINNNENCKSKNIQQYFENNIKHLYCVVNNKVCDYYISMIDYIGQIAYHKKDYKFIQEKKEIS